MNPPPAERSGAMSWRVDDHDRRIVGLEQAREEDHDLVVQARSDLGHLVGEVRSLRRWLISAVFVFASGTTAFVALIIDISQKT